MRLGWIGFHMEGIDTLRALLEEGIRFEAIITLRKDKAAQRSGVVDYTELAARHGVPLHEVANINGDDARALLARLALDLVFVIGWSQILRPDILKLARLGMVGAHASLLPRNRGRAPVNWALIKGESVTGNSLIWLAEEVDAGELIDQTRIPITPYDSCRTIYEQVAASNTAMIRPFLARMFAGIRPGTPQPASADPPLPGRRPEDGRIDWTRPAWDVYNWIRALAPPYPGAFSFLEGRRWIVREAAVPADALAVSAPAGVAIGPLYSTRDDACGQWVACGDGALLLLEVEDDTGAIVTGRTFSHLAWRGKSWTDE